MLSPFPSASASLRDLSQTILAYANSHGWHGREYPGRERGGGKIFAKKFVGDEKFPYLCNVLGLRAGESRTGRL